MDPRLGGDDASRELIIRKRYNALRRCVARSANSSLPAANNDSFTLTIVNHVFSGLVIATPRRYGIRSGAIGLVTHEPGRSLQWLISFSRRAFARTFSPSSRPPTSSR